MKLDKIIMQTEDAVGVGKITKQNTTVDVKPGATQKQAAKFGNRVDKSGRPPELHRKARKNSSPHVLTNLGLGESTTKVYGYKAMNYNPETGEIVSGADSRVTKGIKLRKGMTVKMPGKGIFMSTNRDYVKQYYAGNNDHEALIKFEFDPTTITSGNLTDHENEFTVPYARVVDFKILNHLDEAIFPLEIDKNNKLGFSFNEIIKPDNGMMLGKINDIEVIKSDSITLDADHKGKHGVVLWDPAQDVAVGYVGFKKTLSSNLKNLAQNTFTVSTAVVSKTHEGKRLILNAYILLLQAGYALLSDDMQTPGGMKIWQRLAKTKGINVYAVDLDGNDIKYSAVDPDDLSDADFKVYGDHPGTGELFNLRNDHKTLLNQKSELTLKLRDEQSKIDDDEDDASPSKVRNLDHKLKLIEREIDYLNKEIRAWENHSKTGLNSRLMAVSNSKKKSTTTESKKSNEEIYQLELIRDGEQDVLKVTSNRQPTWIEIRGKRNYETTGYDPNDKLHAFLDKLDPATVAALMAGDIKFLNPNNSRTTPSIDMAKSAWQEPTVAESIDHVDGDKHDKFGMPFDQLKPSGKRIGTINGLIVFETPNIGIKYSETGGILIWDSKNKVTAGVLLKKKSSVFTSPMHEKTWAINVAAVNSQYEGKGLIFKLYVLLIRKGYAVLSDDMQTMGGQKIWARLAKTPGVNVYAVDMNDSTRMSAVDPDDITDADFKVYRRDLDYPGYLDKLEKLEHDLSDWHEEMYSVDFKISQLKNSTSDSDKKIHAQLVDKFEAMKFEQQAIKDEIAALQKHDNPQIASRLMAVADKKITSETTLRKPHPDDTLSDNRFLESFDTPAKWSWKTNRIAIAALSDKSTISVEFDEFDDGKYHVQFQRNDSMEITGDGLQMQVFATVLNIIRDFVEKFKPNVIFFYADKPYTAQRKTVNDASRGRLYNRMVAKFAPTLGMTSSVEDKIDHVKFSLTRLNETTLRKPHPDDTLGVKRKDMPQVHRTHYPEFIDYLKGHGGKFTHREVHAHELKPVQSEFSDAGVLKMMKTGGKPSDSVDKKPLIVSADNYIIDGHHRWLAAWNMDEVVPIMQISIPVKKLFQLVKDFKYATYKDIHERTPQLNKMSMMERACLEGGHIYEQSLDEIKSINLAKDTDDANSGVRARALLQKIRDGKYARVKTIGDVVMYLDRNIVKGGFMILADKKLTTMIGFLRLQPTTVDIKPSLTAGMAWTHPAHRRQGHAMRMYEELLNRGINIVSDSSHTKTSRMVWQRLMQKYDAYLLNDNKIVQRIDDRAIKKAYQKNAPYNYGLLIASPKSKLGKETSVVEQRITEVFDNPYNYQWLRSGQASVAQANTDNGGDLKIIFYGIPSDAFLEELFANGIPENELPPIKNKKVWGINFTKNNYGGATGEGDQQRILATVVKATKEWFANTSFIPDVIDFTADKTDQGVSGGRAKLYYRFAKMFAKQIRYKMKFYDTGRQGHFVLFHPSIKLNENISITGTATSNTDRKINRQKLIKGVLYEKETGNRGSNRH